MLWKGIQNSETLFFPKMRLVSEWMLNCPVLFLFRYGNKFMDDYQAIMTKKLGLPKYNKQLISKLLSHMAIDKVDYTNFFRQLSNLKADKSIPEDQLLVPLKSVLLDIGQERKEAWTDWVKTYIHEVLLIYVLLF